jgi:hypothetical protein
MILWMCVGTLGLQGLRVVAVEGHQEWGVHNPWNSGSLLTRSKRGWLSLIYNAIMSHIYLIQPDKWQFYVHPCEATETVGMSGHSAWRWLMASLIHLKVGYIHLLGSDGTDINAKSSGLYPPRQCTHYHKMGSREMRSYWGKYCFIYVIKSQ